MSSEDDIEVTRSWPSIISGKICSGGESMNTSTGWKKKSGCDRQSRNVSSKTRHIEIARDYDSRRSVGSEGFRVQGLESS